MKHKKILFFFIFFMLFTIFQASSIVIKLGSLAPKGSPWERALNMLQAEWSRISNGSVTLRLYSGGTVGSESDMLRKIRIGQLNAAGLSSPGLSEIFPGIFSIYVPMLVRSNEEYAYLMEKMVPILNEEFENNGYKTLFWMHTGWVYLYSRNRVISPNDLRPQKIWAGEGDPEVMEAWRRMGCIPVALSLEDVTIQLQTGGIDAFVSSPLWVLSLDLYDVATHMNNLKWAPFSGAIAIDTRIWNRIDEDMRNELEQAAQEIADSMKEEWFAIEDDAINTMERYGLTINNVPNSLSDDWAEFIDTGFLYVLENNYDMQYYNMAVQILEEYRQQHSY